MLRRISPQSRSVGDGLSRIRNTSIALLGVVAAIGLGLIAFMSQQGWPGAFSSPIPPGPEQGVVQNDTIALAPAASGAQQTAQSPRQASSPAPTSAQPTQPDSTGTSDFALVESRQVAVSNPADQPGSSGPRPAPTPTAVPPSPSQPPAVSPAPGPEPATGVDETPETDSPAGGPGGGEPPDENETDENETDEEGEGWGHYPGEDDCPGPSVESPEDDYDEQPLPSSGSELPAAPVEYQDSPPSYSTVPTLEDADLDDQGWSWARGDDDGPDWRRH